MRATACGASAQKTLPVRRTVQRVRRLGNDLCGSLNFSNTLYSVYFAYQED